MDVVNERKCICLEWMEEAGGWRCVWSWPWPGPGPSLWLSYDPGQGRKYRFMMRTFYTFMSWCLTSFCQSRGSYRGADHAVFTNLDFVKPWSQTLSPKVLISSKTQLVLKRGLGLTLKSCKFSVGQWEEGHGESIMFKENIINLTFFTINQEYSTVWQLWLRKVCRVWPLKKQPYFV